MTIEYNTEGKLKISIYKYKEKMRNELPTDIQGTS